MKLEFDPAYYINSMQKIWRLKGNSISTLKNYISHLKRYLAEFPCPEVVTKEQRWDYFLKMESGTHRNQAMAVVRQMHEYLFKQPIDWRDLPYTKKKKSLPVYFTEDEIKRLINAVNNPKHRCFIAIQYLCGMRVNEVISLKQSDINTKAGIIRINGKGNKQREVPLPESAILFIRIYWKWVWPKPTVYLFEGQYGGRYSSRSIQKVIAEAKIKSGLQHKTCSTHGLRHAAATARINEYGWSLRHVQQFLGHSSSKTTERYTHVSVNNLKRLMAPEI